METCISCGGRMELFALQPAYVRCVVCGSYIIREFPQKDFIQTFYNLEYYWRQHQIDIGNPPIEERTKTDLADGRVEFWWNIVDELFQGRIGTAIEVGCAHAVFLHWLAQRRWHPIGVEVNEFVCQWVQDNVPGVEIRKGEFPNVELPQCDLFLAMDVLEHSLDPVSFIRGIIKVLKPNGYAIIQTPIDEGINPPFGHRFMKLMLEGKEHLFVFSRMGIARLFYLENFRIISNDKKWRVGHEFIVVQKMQ